jgi:hypothetical protein
MATLDELRAALLPGARRLGPPEPGPEIGWVRVLKARVPAFDALERGDLAIVPGTALQVVASGPAELDALVGACRRAGVAGLVLLDAAADDPSGPAAREALDALDVALARAGPPALRTAGEDAAQLERSIIGFLVNERAELDHRAAVLEGRLEAIALAGGDLDGLVGAVAGFLGRAVALEDPRGGPVAIHAPSDHPDAAAAVARYHKKPGTASLRVPLPGGADSTGSLALLGDRPPSELERAVLDRIAGLVALEVARQDAVLRARDASRRTEALPVDGPPWVVLLARQRTGGDDSVEARERTRRELRLLAPARRLALRGDAESLELRAVLAADDADPGGLLLAARVAGRLGRGVAVSRPFADRAGRPAAEAEARATLEAAEALDSPPGVARADRLAAYRLLRGVQALPDGPRHARTLLEPLLAGRPDIRREHLETLRAVLEQPGLAEAAAALGVHRNTVAYRVRRIEALTGWRLTDPELRLPLALALELVPTDQK